MECGLSYEAAVEHSLPRLRAMASAAARLRAREALLILDSVYAAMAACWSEKGIQIMRHRRRTLQNCDVPPELNG